jgi:23S rRNA pseudouridine2605 synthase
MTERLQKFLSRAGIASRRHAEGLIAEGRVSVNNVRVTTLGTKVDPEKDLVSVDGKVVSLPEEKAYYLLYKPSGMVTTLEDPQGRPTVKDLLGSVDRRVFPVGRLDWDAEGALLFTDDGDLAHHLMHPSFEVPRTYLAKVKGVPDPASLEKLRGGVRLEDGMATPDAVEIFEAAERNTWLKLVVSEGRPHLVKRLCAAIGHPVVRLFRPAQGGVGVEGMRPGQLRPLTPAEVERVHQVAEGKAFPPPALRLPPRRHGRSGEAEEEGAAPFEVPGRAPRASAKAPRGKTSGARGGERRAFSGPRTRGAGLGEDAAEAAPRGPDMPRRRRARSRTGRWRGRSRRIPGRSSRRSR